MQYSFNLALNNEDDTRNLAQVLAQHFTQGVIYLVGELGAGKTTFTRYFLQSLGHTGAVKSPTYTLVEPYELTESINPLISRVYHADLYRLQDPEELSFIGFEEYLDDKYALVIIEWASRADDYLPAPVMTIAITVVKEVGKEVRHVIIKHDDKINFELP